MPSKLQIISGNHLETLVDGLAELVKHPPSANALRPLEPETIVVQSKGMQRWISLAIAKRNGICANMDFPFPNSFLETTYGKAFGPLPKSEAYDRGALAFRIMALLPRLTDTPAFSPIRTYLSAGESQMKLFQLSVNIGNVFDQYLIFRPDIIHSWEKGEKVSSSIDTDWQRRLWLKLRDQTDETHRADLQKKLVEKLIDMRQPVEGLPSRVSIFGISYLPIFHLQVLDALAHRIPVHLFLLNPCRQFWADIVSDKRLSRLMAKSSAESGPIETLHFEKGNRLLGSWGYQGRQFFALTMQMEGDSVELFEDNPKDTLLGHVQQDILDLADRSQTVEPEDPVRPDGSIQIHSCHSPMREVEVLHDRLLGILDTDNRIFPNDILVMTPDIGRYAPYIHAIFGKNPATEDCTIPYTVADQSIPRESRPADAFLKILDLVDGRYEASRVLSLLEYSSIRNRFDIAPSELATIEDWVRESNIRWGWNGHHRKRLGLPGTPANTWRTGLDRLLMGYAMDTGPDHLFEGISPHEGIEGSDSTTLGAFSHFCQALHGQLDGIPQRTELKQWERAMNSVLEALFEPDDDSSKDIRVLRGIFEQFGRIAASPGAAQSVTFDVIRQYVKDHLNRSSYGTGFLGGGVTFCAMLPMRSIPAKVICLLGMQHDAYPQDFKDPGFNLIVADPRPGDRSKRDDDKYLFLESLLSARKIFYISYVGRDIQDNSSKPPSVLVDELLEYAAEAYNADPSQLVTQHPLQAFSPAYFDPNNFELVSYSKENLEASLLLTSAGEEPLFFDEQIPPPDDSWRQCDVDELCLFFAHPVKYLMERRLGIVFRDTTEPIPDLESFNLNPLDRFQIGQGLLGKVKEGKSPDDHYEAMKAAGQLPHGRIGRAAFDNIHGEVEVFNRILEHLVPSTGPQDHQLEIDLPPFHISGQLGSIYPEAMIFNRLARLRPSDLTSAFIRHLSLMLTSGDHLPDRTLVICKDAIWEFGKINDPRKVLNDYLSIYWKGLVSPLPFFGRTSFAYAFGKLVRKKTDVAALREALKMWQDGDYHHGESGDDYIGKCFKEGDLSTAGFETLAIEIYEPLFAAGRQLPADSWHTQH